VFRALNAVLLQECPHYTTFQLHTSWINGPFAASTHDITILRGGSSNESKNKWNKKALYFNIPCSIEKLVGDSGYSGQPDKVTTTSDAHAPETKGLFKRIKSQLETCNGRFKNFNVIGHAFRHKGGTDEKLRKHKAAFEAVAVLVQYDIESGKSLFEVH
jgi:hypothetical protein